jgi:hypothetical protein
MSLNEDKAIWLPIFPDTMVKVCNLDRSETLLATGARNPGFAGTRELLPPNCGGNRSERSGPKAERLAADMNGALRSWIRAAIPVSDPTNKMPASA